ncbi:hypothetical protein C5610_02410 [Idiomarina sp. OT37-5b]|jgi:membrane-bound lytic murein transglycosylase C|uniref:murein transglycosylase domain-containing protein n=1 Tax=Idiomarina sp. OT37-5b TaxID=2100422 RepID=UPI000CF952FF|nr:murein transglycosylase domain-containing protein [Idiomarina sp. OT37-5b]AVJ55254.1 hypothetical protein C5610_02410 [Idiomarina sp. OT37-5b]
MNYWYLGISAATLMVVSTPATTQSYEAFKQQYQQRYTDYQAEYLKSYESFKQRVTAQWGDKAEISDADTYVHYSDDLQQKTVIDYADNSIVVERLSDDAIDIKEVEALLTALSETPVTEQAKRDPILQSIPVANDQTVLASWVPESDVDDILQQATIEASEDQAEVPAEVVQETIADVESEQPATTAPENVEQEQLPPPTVKRIQRMTISLNSGSVYSQRAKPYMEDARQVVTELNLPFALLMAVMQTESSFNPLAQSPIPAFGLMQIVPSTAGLDVNRLVYGKQQPPSVDVLFEASQNMRFGGNYLALLRDRYLKQIENPESRLYCMIAAYNTGAGNVATAFHPRGEKSVQEAIDVINQMTPEAVYQRLEEKLPYQETRAYMGKVRAAMEHYQSI